MRLAHQLCQPNGPYSKSQVAHALGLARGTLYRHSKQAMKDQQIASTIARWHEIDATLGHRTLARLLRLGKHRVRRVMHQYGITPQRRHKRPTSWDEVIYSRPSISVFSNGGKMEVRFLFLRRTLLCLAILYKEAHLDEAPFIMRPFRVPKEIWLYGQERWHSEDRKIPNYMALGYQPEMEKVALATDHDYINQFVMSFEAWVGEQREWGGKEFWKAISKWANVCNGIMVALFVRDYWLQFCPPTGVTWADWPG